MRLQVWFLYDNVAQRVPAVYYQALRQVSRIWKQVHLSVHAQNADSVAGFWLQTAR